MVKLEVEDGKIRVRMLSDRTHPIYEELGQGIVRLLVDFQVEAVKHGRSKEEAQKVYRELYREIDRHVEEIAEREIEQELLKAGKPRYNN